MKKKAKAQTDRRSKKGHVKDLEPRSNPKGGFNFTSDAGMGDGSVRPTESSTLNYAKVDLEYKPIKK